MLPNGRMDCLLLLLPGAGLSSLGPDTHPGLVGSFARQVASHGQTAYGAAASAKYELATYAYYVRILKYYPPTIYHGQDSARYGRMGSD